MLAPARSMPGTAQPAPRTTPGGPPSRPPDTVLLAPVAFSRSAVPLPAPGSVCGSERWSTVVRATSISFRSPFESHDERSLGLGARIRHSSLAPAALRSQPKHRHLRMLAGFVHLETGFSHLGMCFNSPPL